MITSTPTKNEQIPFLKTLHQCNIANTVVTTTTYHTQIICTVTYPRLESIEINLQRYCSLSACLQ